MKTILLVMSFMGFAMGFAVQAATLQEAGPQQEVKTYSQHLKFSALCEVHPAGEYQGYKYDAFCSCAGVSGEIETLIRQVYPHATKVNLPAPADLFQPVDKCGIEPLLVEGDVQFTGN